MDAAADSDDIGDWYLKDATISQTIPAEQAPGVYPINLTLTVVAD